MKIQFDKNQQYQLDAIQAVVDVLEGQPLNQSEFEFSLSDESATSIKFTDTGVGNQLTINDDQLLENIHKVQDTNELTHSEQLERVEYKDENKKAFSTDYPNLSIEMETGTGKTYVYLRTIYELNKTYGFKKFIIVVPSVAIREGVLKNLQITFNHFQELYENTPASFEVYDSKKVVSLANFARSNTIQIMVINIDSFTKDQNIINQIRERGVRPIEHIQATSPIVIVDEPQNMETDIRKKAISNLNPLLTLRYSATHENNYNLIYKLDPVKAYDLGLVKQIDVDSVISKNDDAGAFVSLDGFSMTPRGASIKLTILKSEKSGVAKKQITAKNGEDLYNLSGGVEAYKEGYTINFIDSSDELIEFSSGNTLYKGQPQGGLTDEIQKEMIKATIDNHLKKELEFNQLGIKVLSVFFLDKVANYRTYDSAGNPSKGQFAVWFEEMLSKQLQNPKYKGLYEASVDQMHDGYFSQDKAKKFKDSKEGKSTKDDDAAYELIMKEKEKLLDMKTPLRFIFSHSALREGWDNPNVFQICTLNETRSETKKRQEIGRGLRLCVDQNGIRNIDRAVNRLTVVANESYEQFAGALQKEIEDDCGVSFAGRIKNARERETVALKKNWQLDQNFLDLWNRIKHKTEYQVEYDTKELVARSSQAVKTMPSVSKPQIQRTKTEVKINNEGVGGLIKSSSERTISGVSYDIPDFLGYIQQKTELTRSTIAQIITASGRLSDIFNNPQMFMDLVVKAIKTEFDELKINGIKYEKIAGQSYEMTLFDSKEIESYVDNLIAVKNQDKTLYNYVLIDSLSTPERNFAQECETRDDVLFYIKLPSWFKINTPIGPYLPDWALIKQEDNDQKKIYFVAETKDPKAIKDKTLLRESERMKIQCGEKHFAEFEDVEFQAVGVLSDLKSI